MTFYLICSLYLFKLFLLAGWQGLYILLTMASIEDNSTSVSLNLVTGSLQIKSAVFGFQGPLLRFLFKF